MIAADVACKQNLCTNTFEHHVDPSPTHRCAVIAADVARKHVKDPELLRFIDLECYIWSTVPAELTPMMNAGMVCVDDDE